MQLRFNVSSNPGRGVRKNPRSAIFEAKHRNNFAVCDAEIKNHTMFINTCLLKFHNSSLQLLILCVDLQSRKVFKPLGLPAKGLFTDAAELRHSATSLAAGATFPALIFNIFFSPVNLPLHFSKKFRQGGSSYGTPRVQFFWRCDFPSHNKSSTDNFLA